MLSDRVSVELFMTRLEILYIFLILVTKLVWSKVLLFGLCVDVGETSYSTPLTEKNNFWVLSPN
jgi:hypothetical protein